MRLGSVDGGFAAAAFPETGLRRGVKIHAFAGEITPR